MSAALPEVDRVLAIDPSLRGTGYAVLERAEVGRKVVALTWGVIRNVPALSQSGCLVAIHEKISELIEAFSPRTAAFESVIYVQSYQTAIVLGCARGAALLAAAQRGLSIFEYPPKRIKQAVSGRGAASKEQVAFMVRALLGLTETPASDAADALAVGLAHFQAVDAERVGVKSMEAI